jgi:gliding motility-associated-like protein
MIKKSFYLLALLFIATTASWAQTMGIGKPTFPFSQACANPNFNSFDIIINFTASPSVSPSNQFIVELSNAAGQFTNPVVLATSAPGQITTSGDKIVVAFPTTTSGEGYVVRVRSTVPVASSPVSNPFAAYYKPQDSQFTINNSIPTASYCAGSNYTLRIDPNGNGVTNSPLQFSFLTYNWYKDNGLLSPPTKVASASSGSYVVTQPGIYYVETNYGTCTSDSYSNRVQVFSSTTNASSTITSSKGNPFCPSQGATTLSVNAGNSYQWFKDDVAISGATSQTYQATVPAKYDVKVDLGTCQANATIQLQEFTFNSSIDVPSSNVIDSGQTLSVTATTDAVAPTFQWYLNNNPITGATTNNYVVNNKGTYKVVITQNGSCQITDEIVFTVNYTAEDVPDIPNLISPNGDFINDTWIIPLEYANGSSTNVTIFSASGDIVLQTDNYLNDWPSTAIEFKNINPVFYYIITTQDNKVVKGSITVIK